VNFSPHDIFLFCALNTQKGIKKGNDDFKVHSQSTKENFIYDAKFFTKKQLFSGCLLYAKHQRKC
jgi:hypothetical protein